MLAGTFAAPVGIFLAGRTDTSLAFIGAAVLFLPLFVFLPKLIQRAIREDVDAVILVTINAWIVTIPFVAGSDIPS